MLFEFSQLLSLGAFEREKLETFLQQIWHDRFIAYAKEVIEEDIRPEEERVWQPFLKFDGDQFRTQNYIGFIQQEGKTIEIYPKVFRKEEGISKDLILDHVFYWFSYCSKLHFPVLDASLDDRDTVSFPELLIWHFASYTSEVVASKPYSQYEEVREILASPKGRIDFPSYIRNGLITGNYHHIDCIHEPYLFDNTLNQAIKYVCRLLLSSAKRASTQSLLQQILFHLDEVEDVPCSASDLNGLTLNPLFIDYAPITEWCKRFLNQQLYSSNNYDHLQWALLLPMEYVFEDFVAGFIEKHYSNYFKVHAQKSDKYLSDDPKAFQMRHDLLLENNMTGERIIIDTKYKPRYNPEQLDVKRGVSQADMYQMVSYAYRRGCKKVIMLYPNTSEILNKEYSFKINSGFDQSFIKIFIHEAPFWSKTDYRLVESNMKDTLTKILLSDAK